MNTQQSKKFLVLAIATTVALALACNSASAVTIGSTSLDAIVVADVFHSGGTAGNTVNTSSPATFYSSPSHASDGLWASTTRFGTTYGLGASLGIGLADTDGLEGWGSETTPGLTTTVSSLAPGMYDIYAVFMTTNTGGTDAGLQAAISGNALVDYDQSNRTDGVAGTGDFDLSIAYLGTTAPGSTSFAVDIEQTLGGREVYVGVAYSLVQTAPEPSTVVLAVLGLVGILGGGRSRRATRV